LLIGSWNWMVVAPAGLLVRMVALAEGDARRGTVGRNEINRKMTVPDSAHNDRLRSTTVFSQQLAGVGAVRITSLLLAAVSSGAVWSAALAQDAAVAPAPAAATAAVDPAAPAAPTGEALRAVFIDVAGKVQWRANETSPWQEAKVNDVVGEGVEVRTGLRSHAAMRIGRNATALIDAGTLFQLPTVVQDGDTLRTAAAVKHGRADFKVDKVGLSNDFKVVTPSTTLAVRGTEFAVASGPLKQVEVLGARRNAINAIELKYSLNNTTVQMSRDAASSSNLQNPAHSAVVVASPPATGTGLPVTTQSEAVQTAANGAAPSQPGSSAQATTANRTSARAEKAAGRSGGDNNVVGRVQTLVTVANTNVTHAIEYLMQADGQLDAIEAQHDALVALQGLASARSKEAKEALDAHEHALSTAGEQGAIAKDAIASFDARAARVGDSLRPAAETHFRVFDDERTQASDTLAAIRALVGGLGPYQATSLLELTPGGDGGPSDQVQQLVDEARRAIMAMGDARDAASDERAAMNFDHGDLEAAIASMDQTTRPGAQAAMAEYQLAVASLSAMVQSGGGIAGVAASAQQAVLRLNGLVEQLRAASPTAQMTVLANESLARLVAATGSLNQTYAVLGAVQDARAAAADDLRAESLGLVEQLYQRLLSERVRLVGQWAAIDSGVTRRSGQLRRTVYEAETVLEGVGYAFLMRTLADTDAALAAARAIDLRTNDAETEERSAFDAASELYARAIDENAQAAATGRQIRTDLQALNSAADEMDSGIAGLERSTSAERYLGSDAVIDSLNDMDQAFQGVKDGSSLGVSGGAAKLEEILDGAVTPRELEGLTRQASMAIDAILAASVDINMLASEAVGRAGLATQSAIAAQELADVTQALSVRFGISVERVDSFARASALSATEANSRAEAAQDLVETLLLVAQQNRVEAIAGNINSLLASNSSIGAQAQIDLVSGQTRYTTANEAGTLAFGRFTAGAAAEAVTAQMGAQAAVVSLNEMATVSTQMVAAFDGAEGAAGNAEQAFVSATDSRILTEAHEASAGAGLLRTLSAAQSGDSAGAVIQSAATTESANAARVAATSTVGSAETAKTESVRAIRFQADAVRLQPTVDTFGTNRRQFEAAAASRRQTVETADGTTAALATQAQFFDDVAQALSSRAKTDVATSAALSSSDARSQALAIAAQLNSSVQQARQMEQTASTNAGRLFGRSMGGYVGRAQAAAAGAEAQAIMANAASARAAGSAASAQGIVSNSK
jgi:FecR protein